MQIAILGHGIVGSGVAEVLYKNAQQISRRAGAPIKIKYILDLREFPGLTYSDKFTKDFNIILNDPEVKVVAEAMGGLNPAYEFAKACLNAGKSVVTSNKELVAAKGAELLATAAKNNINFLFEASVGGGIPIIRPMHQCLAANEIYEIAGILNGTTNFILTKMIREDMGFDDALKMAQQLGYAEANPAADVEGMDACRKICILASLAFGSHVYPESVHTQGITQVTAEDVQYAGSMDHVIKLIGRAKKEENGELFVSVSPAFIFAESQLANISDVFNGILVRGDATGDVVFYGKGAGKLPTASAVVGDIIDCAKAEGTIQSLRWKDSDHNNVTDHLLQPAVLYVRCNADIANIRELFGNVRILGRENQPQGEYAFVTSPLPLGELNAKLEALGGVITSMPVLDY